MLKQTKDVKFGYVVPGHGKKGKQMAILLDSDLQEMYKKYEKKDRNSSLDKAIEGEPKS